MEKQRLVSFAAAFLSLTTSGYASSQTSEAIEEIEIIGTKPERYRSTDAISATAFNSEIKDIPRSIQVVTEQTILDQQALNLGDAVKNASGIQTISNFGNTTDSLIIRGFNVRTLFQDGFRLSNNITRIQTTNVERVEVVKGSTALLYGQVQPGGLVNVVTKKPTVETRNYVSTSFDEHGQQHVLGDFTGSLNDDGTLLYRVVASYEDSETFREAASDAEIERTNISPSITWKFSDKDTLTAGFEFIDAELPLDRGTVLVTDDNGNRSLADIPESRRLGEDTDVSDTSQIIVKLDYQHEFNNNLTLDAKFRYQDGEADTIDSNILGFGIPTAGVSSFPLPVVSNLILTGATPNPFGVSSDGQLLRAGFQTESEEENTFATVRLSGEEGIHKFAVGFDYNERESEFDNSINTITLAESGVSPFLPFPLPEQTLFYDLSTINIFDPVYGQNSTEFTPQRFSTRDDTQIGVFVQDLISLSDKWKLLAGLRWDRFDREETETEFLTAFPNPALALVGFLPSNNFTSDDLDSESELSPNAGLVYQPTDNISLYTSYSESFSPNFASNILTGELVSVDAREGQQIEIGVKGSFLDQLLNYNVAYYELTFDNAINGFDGLTGAPVISGEEESTGLELDATVQFADGLNVIFNYAYVDAEITSSATNEGNTPLGVAEHSSNLWVTYELLDGPLKGLGLGGGISYVGERYIDAANSFELDSYTTADITAWYYFSTSENTQLRLQAGVKNVNDEEYFQAAQGTAFDINVGQPRTAYASLAFEF